MKLLFTLLSFCVLFACTITKRHFGAGYHVEWKRNLEKKKTEENPERKFLLETTELIDSSEEAKVPESVPVSEGIPLKEIDEKMVSSADEQGMKRTIEKQHIASRQEESHRKVDNLSIQSLDQPVSEVKKKTEPLTWVSMGIFIGMGISIGLISVFSSFLYLGTGIFITGLVLVLFICSLISFIRVSRHPDRYKNKGLTNFMFALSATCLIIAALYLLYVGAMTSMNLPI
ncbi:hypothetical protein [Fluviicola sp.]|uniref:hypothetical protein n=1 Tax=Fluviicola sp. TaxID=1917219 RepID=UPI00261D5ABE|nr:hypothetical protein [Fluviicola sp.]